MLWSKCVTAKFVCCNPNPQCGHIWNKEVLEVKWGHNGGPLSYRISIFIRIDARMFPLLPTSPCQCSEEKSFEDHTSP